MAEPCWHCGTRHPETETCRREKDFFERRNYIARLKAEGLGEEEIAGRLAIWNLLQRGDS